MDYETIRHAAGSWGLVYLFVLFAGVILFVFLRPGAKEAADEAAKIPFKED